MKSCTIGVIAFLLALPLHSQIRIPWLGANGLYGLADSSGKVLIPAQYESIELQAANQTATQAKKNGQQIFVFRNGVECPRTNVYGTAFLPVYLQTDDTKPANLLPDIQVIKDGPVLQFVDLKTGKNQSVGSYFRWEQPDWFWFTRHQRYELDRVRFLYGLFPILTDQKKINFINTQFKKILPTDYEAATVCDEKYLIAAENKNRMAILDFNGKVLSPWFNTVQPTRKTGVFIINNPQGNQYPVPKHTGLMDISGRFILDTVYQNIDALTSGKGLLVRRTNQDYSETALIDYQGKFIIHFDSCSSLNETGFKNYLRVRWKNGTYNILDENGQKILPRDYSDQVDIRGRSMRPLFFIIKQGGTLTVLDSTTKVLFTDSLDLVTPQYEKKDFVFFSSKFRNNTWLKGIRTLKGQIILPEKYLEINTFKAGNQEYYILNENHQFGLANSEGKILIPCTLYGLQADYQNNDTILWRRTLPNGLWSAYSPSGQKLPYPDYHVPTTRQKNLVHMGRNQKNETNFTISNGKTIPVPDFLKNHKGIYMEVRSLEGGFVVFKGPGEPLIVANERLEDIVPQGFAPIGLFLSKNRFEATGLLSVYEVSEAEKKGEVNITKKATVAPPPPKPVEIDPDMPIAEETISVGTGKPRDRACGILDARGAWVLPPKSGVHYIPISPYLVVETDYEETRIQNRFYFNRKPYTIHKVNQAEKGSFQVGAVTLEYFFKGLKAMAMSYPAIQSGAQAATMAYFDPFGKQLCPWYISKGPEALQRRNFIRTSTPQKGVEKHLLVTQDLTLIKDMGDIWIDNIDDYEPDGGLALTTARAKKGSELMGVLDSNGNWAIEPLFKNLKILIPDRLCSYQNEAGETVLMDWQGKGIYAENVQEYRPMPLPNNRMLVHMNNNSQSNPQALILDADNRISHKIPASAMDVSTGVVFTEPYIRLKNAQKKTVWLRLADGKYFAE
jgi:hypothetical protein